MKRICAGALAILLVALCLAGCRQEAVDTITLTSTAFQNDGTIPEMYTCDGDNVSPPLSWSQPPMGTQSFVLIVDDPDASGFVHWLVYNLPPATRMLPQGVPPDEPSVSGGFQGRGGRSLGYFGPCPPEQDPPHHYSFTIYALDSMLDLPDGETRDQVERAMEGRVLAMGELIGTYARR
jgi:Raf kinase inhibitor-like YbhB/YbcL family protein